MRISATIKDRLAVNAQQRRTLEPSDQALPRIEKIRMEYLDIEAETYRHMLEKLPKGWSFFRNKRLSLVVAITTMSLYVLGIFYMFQEMDLSKVEQWQFAITALPFWLILTLIPVAIITFLTTRNTRL